MKEIICAFCVIFTAVATGTSVGDVYYPRYHLAPPYGWMNDPNGFSILKDEYHLFYQFNPNSSLEPGIAHWGHATSTNLVHWHHQPIALYPDQWYDKTGVFSGSAMVENDTMYLFYTGNVNHPGETPDHEQHQCLAIKKDTAFEKYEKNPIIQGIELQPNIRDPKVWKHKDDYYMVLGNSFMENSRGRVLLYKSTDKINWKQVSILLQSNGTLGYMFECPDFFEIDGRFVLLFSPQGVEPQGDNYRNLYQTGYVVGEFDYESYDFVPLTDFVELDRGHDFYATQTIEDHHGRRVMIAWFDMWEQNYPERETGFTGFMTLPRTLTLSKSNKLIQAPIVGIGDAKSKVLRSGRGRKGDSVVLPNKAGEVVIRSPCRNTEVLIGSESHSVSIRFDETNRTVTLDRGGADGIRRAKWRPRGNTLLWTIYIDASSVELFCGNGEETFSSRFFPTGPVAVRLGENTSVREFKVTEIQRSTFTEQVPAVLNKKTSIFDMQNSRS